MTWFWLHFSWQAANGWRWADPVTGLDGQMAALAFGFDETAALIGERLLPSLRLVAVQLEAAFARFGEATA